MSLLIEENTPQQPVDVTAENIVSEVIEASSEQAVIVQFWAPWCGPCKQLAPVLEKVWAQRAGLGWIGKHTNLIHRSLGSFFFIGELVTDVRLVADTPAVDYCGTCTKCIEACPTDALVAPYQLDARKCIAYLTIEYRELTLPEDLQDQTQNWIFGCDICQDVCPWNKFSRPASEPRYKARPGIQETPLNQWAALDQESFEATFHNSPVKRSRHAGFIRNVKAAIRNQERTASEHERSSDL